MAIVNMSDTSLIFTQSAAAKVHELIVDEGNDRLNLRVFITGGGCSGFQYGFTFDEEINNDDTIITTHVESNEGDGGQGDNETPVKLLVDPMSYQYLRGAIVDYREDINGAQFVIKNPNAKTTCGCGSSFSV